MTVMSKPRITRKRLEGGGWSCRFEWGEHAGEAWAKDRAAARRWYKALLDDVAAGHWDHLTENDQFAMQLMVDVAAANAAGERR